MLPALSVAEQVTTWPLVLAVMMVGATAGRRGDARPASVGVGHVTVTSLVYQPLSPSVPTTVGGPTVGPGVVHEHA